MAKLRKLLKRLLLALLVLIVGALVLVALALRASLPQLEGERALAGLSAPVEVARDELGVVTLRAANRNDAFRALGFVHAQERFFIMDLTRRDAAGELSELFGEVALAHDERRRLHRFRHRAREALAGLSDAERAQFDAYVAGVNAGLAALEARPPEYYLLGARPQPWTPEDSVLVVYAMFFDLQDERAERDANLGLMYAVLPEPLAEFLSPPGSEHDAPLDDSRLQLPDIPAMGPPPASGVSNRAGPADDRLVGSNNWAVAAQRSSDGRAWLANDMHLGLRNPNIWFRARLRYDHQGVPIDVTGVTLPGTPGVVAGSSGRVAWGYTNSYGDFSDRIVLETDPGDPDRYRTPAGWRRLQRYTETIGYGGDSPREVVVRESIWGPVVESDDGGLHAIRWTAHAPQAVNLLLADMPHAANLDSALTLANRVGAPAQNFVAADHAGRVGWTLMGRLPQRSYPASRLPVPWAEAGAGDWRWLPAADYPRFTDPADGLIWTANARVIGGEALARIGDGGYASGFRAGQIRDGLRARAKVSRADHLDIHLDDRALFLQRWQELLLDVLDGAVTGNDAGRGELRAAVARWGARASADSNGYLAVRRFRLLVMESVIGGLTAAVSERFPAFQWNRLGQLEQPLWTLLRERPPHLLPDGFESWEAVLLDAADRTHAELSGEFGGFANATWGARNQVAVRHPMSSALPDFIADYLDLPVRALPGDSHMPRVQSPGFGASERMAVSPGDEAAGYFHMPGGQSGHVLSPFYRAGHEDWEAGRPTSFLPGETRYLLTLETAP